MIELDLLPLGAVIKGPEWHDEVYQKTGDDRFATIGTENSWTIGELARRGPFSVMVPGGRLRKEVAEQIEASGRTHKRAGRVANWILCVDLAERVRAGGVCVE